MDMFYTELTKKAMRIAYDAHKEQVDKSGLPYIFHPFHLAEQMEDEISICVALLHDVVEDTAITFEDLAAQGILDSVIEALKLLTHDDAVPYMNYVQKIKESGNEAAIAVKLADLRHNSDISRLDRIDEKAILRIEKYKRAIEILERRTPMLFIDYESATGLSCYTLRVDEIDTCCWSWDGGPPRPYSDPILTRDLINNKTFSTHKNPAYENIIITPGLRLLYPVFDGDGTQMIAKMERIFQTAPFLSTSVQYSIVEADQARPLNVCLNGEGAMGSHNDIIVRISRDESFKYNPRSLVEERYILDVDEANFKWLHHIFHAFISAKFAH